MDDNIGGGDGRPGMNHLRDFLSRLVGNPCSKCESFQAEVLGELTDEEKKEIGIIATSLRTLNSELDALKSRGRILGAREELLTEKIKLRLKIYDREIRIEDGKVVIKRCVKDACDANERVNDM